MNPKRNLAATAALWLAGATALVVATPLAAQQPKYTVKEYNDYQACANEKVAQQKIKVCEDFLAKYPQSELLPYLYNNLYTTYNEQKNYPKTIEYADKLLAYKEKIDLGTRLQAHYVRALAFQLSSTDPESCKQARPAALEAISVLNQLPKPDNMTQEQFDKNKEGPTALFNYTAGLAALCTKDYPAAIESFQNALKANPNDPVTYFRLGVAYLQKDPPQHLDGFWALARAIALKGPNEAQLRTYLRNQMLRYQIPLCEKELDKQMNAWIFEAGSKVERPAELKFPSRDELNKLLETSSIDSIVADLKAGGEKGAITWLATCGAEFPELGGKVFDITEEGDAVVLTVFTSGDIPAIEAATAPNMRVRVEGQPEAKRLKKDDQIVYSATIDSFVPEPFMLQLVKGKVKPEYIPEEEKTPAPKKATKRPPKKPGR